MGTKRRPGRPKTKTPKDHRLTIHLTAAQFAAVLEAAGAQRTSPFVTDTLLEAIGFEDATG